MLDAVDVFDESLAARDPCARLRELATKEHREAQPKRSAGGSFSLTLLEVDAVEAIDVAHEVELAADQIRSEAEALEVVRIEWSGFIRDTERL